MKTDLSSPVATVTFQNLLAYWESEKADLELKIQNSKIMASTPITSWQIDGETRETVTDFIFLVQMVTAAMKLRQLLLGRKAVTNLDSILKSRDITLLTMF